MINISSPLSFNYVGESKQVTRYIQSILKKGISTTILGLNGSGKTTLSNYW